MAGRKARQVRQRESICPPSSPDQSVGGRSCHRRPSRGPVNTRCHFIAILNLGLPVADGLALAQLFTRVHSQRSEEYK